MASLKSYWMKKKGEAPVLIKNTPENPYAVSQAFVQGFRPCDGPDDMTDEDCGCHGEKAKAEEQGTEE